MIIMAYQSLTPEACSEKILLLAMLMCSYPLYCKRRHTIKGLGNDEIDPIYYRKCRLTMFH